MDTGEGRFEMFESEKAARDAKVREYHNARGIFSVDEELEIRGSWFKVKKITPFGINLKLLKGPSEKGGELDPEFKAL